MLKPAFQAACRAAIEELARESADGPALVDRHAVGRWRTSSTTPPRLIADGRIAALRFKVDLPNYGVFDEKRVFAPGPMPGPVSFRGVRIGLPICEDIWGAEPAECIAETGGEILLVPNGSPYRRGVVDERLNVAVARVTETRLPLLYVNQVGGQDELVFDGASFALNADGSLAAQLAVVSRGRRADALDAHRQTAGVAKGRSARRGGRQGRLLRLRAGAARLRREERISRRRVRPFGRRRFRVVRGARGRCARPRPRPRGHAAVSLHVASVARRCGRCRQGARHSVRHGADRERGRRT